MNKDDRWRLTQMKIAEMKARKDRIQELIPMSAIIKNLFNVNLDEINAGEAYFRSGQLGTIHAELTTLIGCTIPTVNRWHVRCTESDRRQYFVNVPQHYHRMLSFYCHALFPPSVNSYRK